MAISKSAGNPEEEAAAYSQLGFYYLKMGARYEDSSIGKLTAVIIWYSRKVTTAQSLTSRDFHKP